MDSKRDRKIKQRYRKLKENRAPGELMYVGEGEYDFKIKLIEYDKGNIEYKDYRNLDEINMLSDDKVIWIDFLGLKDEKIIEEVGRKFDIHSLILEDIIDGGHRPKIDYNEDSIFMIGKTLDYDNENKEVFSKQISFILKKNILLTFRDEDIDIFDNVLERLDSGMNIRNHKADYLFYALLDAMVDSYFIILEIFDENLDILEDNLLDNPTKELLNDIYKMKKENVYIRNSIWPIRSIIGSLSKNDYDIIEDRTMYYLRDIYDHIIQIIDIVENYRDTLSGMLDTYLSSVANKTNDIMKVLTIFSTIFIPLTFLSGLYGTNFPNIPIFRFKYSYQLFLIINIVICIGIFRYLKKKDWI